MIPILNKKVQQQTSAKCKVAYIYILAVSNCKIKKGKANARHIELSILGVHKGSLGLYGEVNSEHGSKYINDPITEFWYIYENNRNTTKVTKVFNNKISNYGTNHGKQKEVMSHPNLS